MLIDQTVEDAFNESIQDPGDDSSSVLSDLIQFGNELQSHKGTVINALQAQLEFFIEQEKDALKQYRYFVANNRPELKNYWRNQMSSLYKKRAKVVRMLTMFKGL